MRFPINDVARKGHGLEAFSTHRNQWHLRGLTQMGVGGYQLSYNIHILYIYMYIYTYMYMYVEIYIYTYIHGVLYNSL